MRSFIKAHRRGESVTSDHFEPDESKSHLKTTPVPSPAINNGQFSSPNTYPGSSNSGVQSSLSSPKKLLTPIKNLFSSSAHQKSSATTPSTSDSLQNAVKSHKRKLKSHTRSHSHTHSRSQSSISNVSENSQSDIPSFDPQALDVINQSHPFQFHQMASSSPSLATRPQPQTPQYPHSGQTRLKPPINLESRNQNTDQMSSYSLARSDKFETKSVSFGNQVSPEFSIQNTNYYSDSEHDHQEYEEEEDSDSSSQFSFVKDKNCGRNTSVKYYKTVKAQPEEEEDQNLEEFGFEGEDFSDYDFENNGLDDDYDDDDVHYNELFDEEIQTRISDDSFHENLNSNSNSFTTSIVNETIKQDTFVDSSSFPQSHEPVHEFLEQKSTHKIYNKSYHLSIQGSDAYLGVETPETDAYEDDILENYLDMSKTPSVRVSDSNSTSTKTPELSDSDYKFEASSPIINGLTVGNNLRHRLPRLNSNESKDTHKLFIHRSFMDDEGDTTLENDPTPIIPQKKALELRALKSFHGSISDTLNQDVIEKTDTFERFTNRHNPVGLGIEQKEKEKEQKQIEKEVRKSEDKEQKQKENEVRNSEVNEPKPKEKEAKENKEILNPRHSINELMNLLSNLEPPVNSQEEIKPVDDITPIFENREESGESDAINSTLSQLEDGKDEIKNNRSSILGMMNLLSNLEQSQVNILEENNKVSEKAQQNRKSILEMMSTLSSLETASGEDSTNKRDSINNMMQTLAKLDLSGPKEERKKETVDAQKDVKGSKGSKGSLYRFKNPETHSSKRYSWFNNDESVNFTSLKSIPKPSNLAPRPVISESENETSDTEAYNKTLDQDLIDEINQLPEDFDFEDLNYTTPAPTDQPSFFRTNSYNNRPIKALIDNKTQSNKIETSSKTVTFYRSNSNSNSLEAARSRSISRAPSIRSMNSFSSVTEDQEEEDEAMDGLGFTRSNEPNPLLYGRKKSLSMYSKPNQKLKPTISFR